MMQVALNLDKYSDNKPKTIMRGGLSLSWRKKKSLDLSEKLLNELVGKHL